MTRSLKGIVLAGGKSLRFGTDKALAEMNGERLIEKPVKLLRSIGLEPVLISNPKRNYAFLNCRIENDLIPDRGPLGGLYTAFKLFPGSALLVLTCDMPQVTQTMLDMLVSAQQAHKGDVTLFKAKAQQLQPFPGIYSAALFPLLGNFSSQKNFSMMCFLQNVKSIQSIDIAPLRANRGFANINTKDDLARYGQ